jgi:anti-sigma regulatory factor (Ser/Thr protein kinase)
MFVPTICGVARAGPGIPEDCATTQGSPSPAAGRSATCDRGTVLTHRDFPMRPGMHAVCSITACKQAVSVLRGFAHATATNWGVCDEAAYALCIVVSELATNAVLHSGSTDIELAMRIDGFTAIVQVKDTGRWTPSYDLDGERPGDDQAHGRGLNIVRAYAARCVITSATEGTTARAEIDVLAPVLLDSLVDVAVEPALGVPRRNPGLAAARSAAA